VSLFKTDQTLQILKDPLLLVQTLAKISWLPAQHKLKQVSFLAGYISKGT